ncbi:MAG: hypothetical protein QXL43_02190, partial [Methanolinea sp.]
MGTARANRDIFGKRCGPRQLSEVFEKHLPKTQELSLSRSKTPRTTFETFGLHEACKRVQKVGDRLSEFASIIDWDQFRPILEDLYRNKEGKGGRPNIDPVV